MIEIAKYSQLNIKFFLNKHCEFGTITNLIQHKKRRPKAPFSEKQLSLVDALVVLSINLDSLLQYQIL